MSDTTKTLYERLGGYDAVAAVANDLLPRLRSDAQLGGFWAHRGEDGIMREKQLLIDFLCASASGPMYYRGRDMTLVHKGMRISESDWNVFLGHAEPSSFVAEMHDRMPVLLNENDYKSWLSGAAGTELFRPAAEDLLQRWPVSKRVNSSRAPDDDPTLIEPIGV